MIDEEWRTISKFPDYAVSDHGRVKRIAPAKGSWVGRILKPRLNRYAYLTLYRDAEPFLVTIHRLVCIEFHGPPPPGRPHAAHWDGDGMNNFKENLRWASHVENEADKRRHGRHLSGDRSSSRTRPECRPRGASHGRHTKPWATARGERGGMAKLTEQKITAIRLDGRPRKVIARQYGISVTMVGFIQRGISWSHVPMPTKLGEQS